jgi:hypothetical protein
VERLRAFREDDEDSLHNLAPSKQRPQNEEGRKYALVSSRGKAVVHFLLFHAVPLGIAVALIILNIQNRNYGSDPSLIQYFQFAAKAHEILMQASIVR